MGSRAYLPCMMRTVLICLVVLFSTVAPALAAGALDTLVGKKNAVLLFAKSRSDASLDRQISMFSERRPDVTDNDIVVLLTTDNRDTMAVVGYASLPSGVGRKLIREYNPEGSGLTIILVGKDGMEKDRWSELVDPQEIFDLLEALPEEEVSTTTGG